MKRFMFTGMLFYAAMLFFLVSCGGNGNAKKTNTDTIATADTTTGKASQVNTTITMPQNMVVIKHKVLDFAKWKPAYDAHDSVRLSYGIHNYVIGRGIDDSNMVLVSPESR